MIRKSLQSSQAKEITADNSNSSKNQQLQQLNLEQLDVVSGGTIGNDNEWRYVPVRR